MMRRHLVLGIAILAALPAALFFLALLAPEKVSRAWRAAWGEGREVEGRVVPPARVAVGTPVRDEGRLAGRVARDRGEGRVELLLEPDASGLDAPVPLARVENPRGIAWALQELVTSDVVREFVTAASRSRLSDSLEEAFDVVLARLKKEFPDVYAANRERIDATLSRLWKEELAAEAETLAADYVVPKIAEEVEFGEVGKEVLSGTLEEAPKEAALAVLGNDEAQAELKRVILEELAQNERLRDGLKKGTANVWEDPEFRQRLAESVKRVFEDESLRQTAGGVLSDTLEETLPGIEKEIFDRLEASGTSEFDLSPVVRKLLLDEKGLGIRPALARVLRRELLEKDLYELVVVREGKAP
ncbi:MAG: hypothetical protein HY720_04680 [Planctomycetes bacterium]|nr:hypothetical protein [Planctomycetota bacterium]